MNTARKLTLVIALLLSAAPAALAQSAYTTGTLSNSVAAGYPSPYGTGSGLYAYAPGLGVRHGGQHSGRAWSSSARGHDPALYDYVPSDPWAADPRFNFRYQPDE
jgi:hypothetical protein